VAAILAEICQMAMMATVISNLDCVQYVFKNVALQASRQNSKNQYKNFTV